MFVVGLKPNSTLNNKQNHPNIQKLGYKFNIVPYSRSANTKWVKFWIVFKNLSSLKALKKTRSFRDSFSMVLTIPEK